MDRLPQNMSLTKFEIGGSRVLILGYISMCVQCMSICAPVVLVGNTEEYAYIIINRYIIKSLDPCNDDRTEKDVHRRRQGITGALLTSP